jgi:hypothetical protein
MVAKPTLFSNGMKFDKAGDAQMRFQAILNDGEMQTRLSGAEHTAVDVLFRDYCAATEWPMPDEPVSYFRDWVRAEGRSTKGFYVEYANGKVDDFSYIKAVRAVANWKR